MSGPLAGCKVVDLSWGVAGPFATMFMADYGADVIKVEPPGGDPYRDLLPAYRVWQRGKQSLILDLKSDSGQQLLRRLLEDADVLLESYAPGVTDRLGISYAALSADYPRLVYCSIRGYGQEAASEHAGFDALVQARAGLFGEQAGVREGPVFSYYPLASYGAGYLAAIGTLAALHVRHSTGTGQHVDTSLMDGVLAHFALQFSQADKPTAAFRAFRGVKRHVAPTVDSYSCSDGRFLHIHTGAKGAFERICETRWPQSEGVRRLLQGPTFCRRPRAGRAVSRGTRGAVHDPSDDGVGGGIARGRRGRGSVPGAGRGP